MLVVGNGPSLNKTPLDAFRGVPSIGMNKIDLIYPRTTWRPNFVVCMNSMVVRQHWAEWLMQDTPVFVNWSARRNIPLRHRGRFNFFYNRFGRSFSLDPPSGLGASETVTYAALQLAFFSGANPVIIVGVDHSFQNSGKKLHYERWKGPDVNHFDANYFKDGSLWGVPDLQGSEDAYCRALRAFRESGREIYDATIGGKLDVFPKIDIKEALDRATKVSN